MIINNIIEIYRLKKISNNIQHNKELIIKIGYIIKNIYNCLIDNYEFKYLLILLKIIFNNIKNISNNIDFLNYN